MNKLCRLRKRYCWPTDTRLQFSVKTGFELESRITEERGNMEGEKGRVCVTGGAGFMASWLIMKLLQRGYSVNATVRSHPSGRKKDVSFLKSLPQAQDRLHIFTADLNDPESFKPAVEGCVGLFHTANFSSGGGETEEMYIDKSVRAMQGILQVCIDSKTVKRVVYTSSTGAVIFKDRGADGVALDEGSWSDVDSIRKSGFPGVAYCISKMMTERVALEFGEKHGLDVVTVVPPWIHGPFVCPHIPGSVHFSLGLIFGNMGPKYGKITPFVHTDDVSEAHIYLFEYPEATGRYICSGAEATPRELVELLSSRYPEYKLLNPEILSDRNNYGGVSSKKLLETGFTFKYGLEEMYDDAIKCCKQKGFL